MSNNEKKENVRVEDILGIISEGEGKAEDETGEKQNGTLESSQIVAPTEEELAKMSADERKEVFSRLLASIDETVNDRVAALSEEYRKGIEGVRDTTVKHAFSNSEKFGGFGESIAAIDSLIEKVPVLKTLPSNEKYTVAYLINEGIKARENKGALTAEAIVSLVNSRPDAMRMLEAQRAKELSASYASTPAFAASSGAASIPANIKNTPRNLDEARNEAYSSFGLKI